MNSVTPRLDEIAVTEWLVTRFAALAGCPCSEVDLDRPFADYSLDSSVAVSIASDLEQTLQRNLPVTAFWEYPSIRMLSRAVAHTGASADPMEPGHE